MLKILSQEEEHDLEFIWSRNKIKKSIFPLGKLTSQRTNGMNILNANFQILSFEMLLRRSLKNLAKAMNSHENFNIVSAMT